MGSIAYDSAYAAALVERRAQIMERVERAARASGRTAGDVTVCAVSKTVGIEQVAAARAAGYTAFAENRPQELERKCAQASVDASLAGAAWHMIGNLQTNKINHVLACRPALVHSVSSLELAEALSRRAQVRSMVQPVLLEVNVSGEESKSGMSPEGVRAALDSICSLEGIAVRGLMTMAPQGDPCAARETFRGLRELRDELAGSGYTQLVELSMGMSEDFEEAVRQGATIVRLGRLVFDPTFPLNEG